MEKHVIIIGGGTAGCTAAGKLAREGYRVTILERERETGGKILGWHQLFPDRRSGSEVTLFLQSEIDHPMIRIMSGAEPVSVESEHGMFMVNTTAGRVDPADAILFSTGFDLFDASRKEEYGYGIYDNVITSAELERMFREGKISNTSGVAPGRVIMVHCVGSRDEKAGNFHCSKVCCVTAVKQAIEIKEKLPASEVFCYYMDMRMFGPYYEELYREAQEKWGVNFIRGRVSEVGENIDGRLVIKAEDTLAGRPLRMEADLVVLMVGMENSKAGVEAGSKAGLSAGINGFFRVADNHYATNISEVEGLFYAGSCVAPMNVTDTITHARSAAGEIIDYLEKKRKKR